MAKAPESGGALLLEDRVDSLVGDVSFVIEALPSVAWTICTLIARYLQEGILPTKKSHLSRDVSGSG